MSSDPFDFAGHNFPEVWIVAPAGQTEAALAGRTPLMGGPMPDGRTRFGTLFTDRDLAERFIQATGMGAVGTPVRFEWREEFVAFLQTVRAAGFTHFVVDPAGLVRSEKCLSIAQLLAVVNPHGTDGSTAPSSAPKTGRP